MRLLGVHSHGFGFQAKEQATASADSLESEDRARRIDSDCLVVFTAVEEGDTTTLVTRATTDITERARQLGVSDIVVYPYVHLTEHPASIGTARSLLAEIVDGFTDDLSVSRAPFGWYKSFELACLGHPLSEWSARYDISESEEPEQPERKGSDFVRFVVVDERGAAFDLESGKLGDCPALSRSKLLRQFVRNELEGREGQGEAPEHVDLMRRHELVDYCEVSEKGHYKWYPKGVLIRKLLLDYIRVDVDDRDDTVGKKIRNAEREWVPYIVVVGQKEVESGKLSVRRRDSGDQIDASVQDLVGEIEDRMDDMPRQNLSLPTRLSMRPVFYG